MEPTSEATHQSSEIVVAVCPAAQDHCWGWCETCESKLTWPREAWAAVHQWKQLPSGVSAHITSEATNQSPEIVAAVWPAAEEPCW